MKSKNTNTLSTANLIGQNNFKQFLEIQAAYGYAQRGGSKIPAFEKAQSKRLTSNVNLLESAELKKVVFNEIIYSN
jgi:hypothetical protein